MRKLETTTQHSSRSLAAIQTYHRENNTSMVSRELPVVRRMLERDLHDIINAMNGLKAKLSEYQKNHRSLQNKISQLEKTQAQESAASSSPIKSISTPGSVFTPGNSGNISTPDSASTQGSMTLSGVSQSASTQGSITLSGVSPHGGDDMDVGSDDYDELLRVEESLLSSPKSSSQTSCSQD